MTSRRLFCAALATLSLAGCAGMRNQIPPQLYDLGPAQPQTSMTSLPPVALADADAPAWLDAPLMVYRLAYTDPRQPRAYAQSRWSMPPPDLLTQRLKTRLVQAGGTVLAPNSGVAGAPVLRLEVDEFEQVFDRPDASRVRISARLSALDGRRLIGQKSFVRELPAPSADAAGGAAALATAADATIADMLAWLATLPLAPR
ncbi:ABC-type transport auxiliary lipoprotein family protein [Noviherbaspirillum pedocola]|uniref:Membrane integrity-associated transporter subunit PqiC n=1 Tax=Noviherbaspirillum pedocola TaxID=2801341 RepID=A0A934W909_9BURK|nr:ABC-type transport auxiliary lipoprotein family protein [Noviherbaspirillum pedocola]MBK4736464.1 membrane integrity-associated transporter subunit PqiC [Noviherbaspirillum pedocola]